MAEDDIRKGLRSLRPQAEIGLADPLGGGAMPGGPSLAGLLARAVGLRQETLFPQVNLARPRPIRGVTQPYKSDWRGEKPSRYNPDYFHVEDDILRDDAGNVVAVKQKLLPKPHLVPNLEHVQKDPDLMYRGLSAREYDDIINTGRVQSRGDYNFDSQKGLTYFSTRPSAAEFYASDFAPPQFKPNWDRPAYAIAARRVPVEQTRHAAGTDPSEIGVSVPLPAENITNVYRGNVVAHTPAWEAPGWKQGPSSTLHWEEIPLLNPRDVLARTMLNRRGGPR